MAELEGLELVKAIGERVMGWDTSEDEHNGLYPCLIRPPARGNIYLYRDHHSVGVVWSPLTSYDDAFEVVNTMRAKGYNFDLETGREWSRIRFAKIIPDMGGFMIPTEFEREGICIAALRALSQQCWPSFKEEMAFWDRLGKRAAFTAVKGESNE